jgi:hypothetical protein
MRAYSREWLLDRHQIRARLLQLAYGRWAQLSVNATVYVKKGRFRLSRLAAYESCTY